MLIEKSKSNSEVKKIWVDLIAKGVAYLVPAYRLLEPDREELEIAPYWTSIDSFLKTALQLRILKLISEEYSMNWFDETYVVYFSLYKKTEHSEHPEQNKNIEQMLDSIRETLHKIVLLSEKD